VPAASPPLPSETMKRMRTSSPLKFSAGVKVQVPSPLSVTVPYVSSTDTAATWSLSPSGSRLPNRSRDWVMTKDVSSRVWPRLAGVTMGGRLPPAGRTSRAATADEAAAPSLTSKEIFTLPSNPRAGLKSQKLLPRLLTVPHSGSVCTLATLRVSPSASWLAASRSKVVKIRMPPATHWPRSTSPASGAVFMSGTSTRAARDTAWPSASTTSKDTGTVWPRTPGDGVKIQESLLAVTVPYVPGTETDASMRRKPAPPADASRSSAVKVTGLSMGSASEGSGVTCLSSDAGEADRRDAGR